MRQLGRFNLLSGRLVKVAVLPTVVLRVRLTELQSIARREEHPMVFYRYLVVLATANEGRGRSRLSDYRQLFRLKRMEWGSSTRELERGMIVSQDTPVNGLQGSKPEEFPERLNLGSYSKVPTTIYTGTTLRTVH
jgi:hypothetical protein